MPEGAPGPGPDTSTPLPDAPSRRVRSADGTPIAVYEAGPATLPPIVLVHGTTADHHTWRIVAPALAARRRVVAIDRRGRGESGDGDDAAYALGREFDDLVAVAEALASATGQGAVDVVGHSLGGRIAFGASLRTDAIGRVVSYEGAPLPTGAEGVDPALEAELRADLAAGDLEGMLARFMTVVVGMPAADLAAFRADPIWPRRVAAAPTILRELAAAERDPEAGLDALAAVRVPVLQLVGSLSPASFRAGAEALDARLADGRLEVIEGARHGAQHSHAAEFVARVEAFLGPPRHPRA